MKRRRKKIVLELKPETIAFLKKVAKLANVSVDDTLAVLLSAKIIGGGQ